MNSTVVIIEDDAPIRRAVCHAVEQDFTRIVEATDAQSGVDAVAAEQPGLVVLDLGLPNGSGLEVCRIIRSWSTVPILVLSARHGEQEKIALLDAGADDYVTKPFSTPEFQARARAVTRRAIHAQTENSQVCFGSFAMNLSARTLEQGGRTLHLTPIEWELLSVLVSARGRTLTHQQLFTAVWAGRKYGDAQQYLRAHVANLRRKIEDDALNPRYIVTEPGVGYRFIGR